jgi:uncharacterized protein YjbI with pentapeptide repeats
LSRRVLRLFVIRMQGLLTHASRQSRSWLISDVRQRNMPTVIQGERFTGNESLKRSFEDATLVDCCFEDYEAEGAMLTSAVFVGCTLKRVDFYWASMFRARFIKCEMEAVSFRGASMMEVVFAHCRLIRCDFSHDNLGVDTDLTPLVFHQCEQIDCDYTKAKNA